MARINLIPNASFRDGRDGWVPTGNGSSGLQVSPFTLIGSQYYIASEIIYIYFAVQPGLKPGDRINVAGFTSASGYNKNNTAVLTCNNVSPYTISYAVPGAENVGSDTNLQNCFATVTGVFTDNLYESLHNLRVVKTATQQCGAITEAYISISAETEYAASADVTIPFQYGSSPLTVAMYWYRIDDGVYVLTGGSASIATSPTETVNSGDGWQRLGVVATAPADTTHCRVAIYQATTSTANDVFFIENVLLEASGSVQPFSENLSQAQENAIVDKSLIPRQRPTIGGMELNADIQLGDLVLNTVDDSDVVWVCTDIEGWWTNPDPEVPDIPRGVQDGSYQVSGRYASRNITLSGVFLPPDPTHVGDARERLISTLNLVREGAWLKTSEDPTRQAYVRLTGRPQIQTVNARGRTEFSVGLRAADPIKYHYDDAFLDGVTETEDIPGYYAPDLVNHTDGTHVENIGNAVVTADFVLTGPAGAGSTITAFHVDNNTSEVITIAKDIRGALPIAAVTFKELTDNIAVLTTDADHQLSVGDIIDVSGVGGTFDGQNITVYATTNTAPFTVSYLVTAADIRQTKVTNGAIALSAADIVTIDTYNRSVSLNGDTSGHRSLIAPLNDFIQLTPGVNIVTLKDSIGSAAVTAKSYTPDSAGTGGTVSLTTGLSHLLQDNEPIIVALPTEAEIAFKSIENNIATITTTSPHGFSAGDAISVDVPSTAQVLTKEVTNGVARLTVDTYGAVVDQEGVNVALRSRIAPGETVQATTKSRTNDVVTIETNVAHGFSNGDSVTVTIPSTSTVATKARTTGSPNDTITLTTSAAHGLTTGDIVSVTLPTTATVIKKSIDGNTVVLTTDKDHGFSVSDKITVALTTNLTPTSLVYSGAPNYLVTAVFSEFPEAVSVGDKITVSSGVSSSASVTHRASSGATKTLTTSVAHNFKAGEVITVADVSAGWNGTVTISAVPTPTTLQYVRSVSTAVRFSNTTTRTIVTASNHEFATGDQVTITGLSSQYNGTFSITKVNDTSFTYTGTSSYNESGVADSAGVVSITATQASIAVSPAGTIVNNTIYNGYETSGGAPRVKYVESVDTIGRSISYRYYGPETALTPTLSSPAVVDVTNSEINGASLTITAVSVYSAGPPVVAPSITYTKGL